MSWWARRTGTGSGSAAGRGRTHGDGAVLRAFATRTVRDTWTVDTAGGHRVLDGFGGPRFRLHAGTVRSVSGEILCTVRQTPPRDLSGNGDPDRGSRRRTGSPETTSLLVRTAPEEILVARMRAASTGPVIALLLPDEGTRPEGGLRAEQTARSRTGLDRPWAESARALGPLSYHATLVADGDVAGRLCDFAGRTVLTDHRRYRLPPAGQDASSLQTWSLNLLDNPLPDAWLLGLLYGTLLLCPPPPPKRDRR